MVFGVVDPSLWLSLFSPTTMKCLFNNKRKKSPKSFPQGTFSTDAATGPVSYPNIGPEGGQTRSNQGPEVDQPDLTVALDNRMDEDC